MAEQGRHLYFIRIAEGPVKIGRSSDVKKRLRMLQCASPYDLSLLGVLEDEGHCEPALHSNLDAHRLRGEWFEWVDLVARAVTAAITDGRWRSVFGFEEPGDIDWRTGSPLYEKAEPRHARG